MRPGLWIVALLATVSFACDFYVTDLRVEYVSEPTISFVDPRFSWVLRSENFNQFNAFQTSYQVCLFRGTFLIAGLMQHRYKFSKTYPKIPYGIPAKLGAMLPFTWNTLGLRLPFSTERTGEFGESISI
jgi:hypothetical protein